MEAGGCPGFASFYGRIPDYESGGQEFESLRARHPSPQEFNEMSRSTAVSTASEKHASSQMATSFRDCRGGQPPVNPLGRLSEFGSRQPADTFGLQRGPERCSFSHDKAILITSSPE